MDSEQARAPFRGLRQFLRAPIEPARSVVGPCELCSEGLPPEHKHLWERSAHTVRCVCNACSLLMGRGGAGAGKYCLVPERYLLLEEFVLSDSAWNELLIPVNMAFLVWTPAEDRRQLTAFYPGPAGAIESLLDECQWQPLLDENPILAEMEPEVEALLIQRLTAPYRYYLVPIDSCYQLVGMIRRTWRGFSGGATVWQGITDYFAAIQAKSTVWKYPSEAKGSMNARSKL
ncbi:DUF5947 family protein [Dictyobacter kobayashii]|uniref:Uncharacterized protein n=1 Tax=Dictyobacter kobayashii TaxID=2014872 RepID=A0A402AYV6_9CHLR|nr:DUF5947 family protein [Dictyobacter kobayashii]GCE24296.1 hypothetical protein KDK_80960 [Dictyobacter kobayashii]